MLSIVADNKKGTIKPTKGTNTYRRYDRTFVGLRVVAIFMKQTLKIIFGLLLVNNSLGQSLDTLKVIVLSPNKIEVSDNFLVEYNKLKTVLQTQRTKIKEQKIKQKNENIEELNHQPDYFKKMFDNELNFYESLTIENYISLVVREYIAYRLYKPFKIKPRLVFVSKIKSLSDLIQYSQLSTSGQNLFIISFPTMKISKENDEFRVMTQIELYSAQANKVLFSKQNIGLAKTGLTDYTMCSGENWDCAYVNSVYPSLYDILKIIVDKNANKK